MIAENEILPNSYITLNFGSSSEVMVGTGYMVTNNNKYDTSKDYQYKYTTSSLIVSNLAAVTAGDSIIIQCRVLFSASDAYLELTVNIDQDPSSTSPLFQDTVQ